VIIEKFKSAFTDILRPNLYKVHIDTPSGIDFTEDLQNMVVEASFPFFTFNTTNSFYNNKENSIVNKIDFDPITLTFLVDSDKKVLQFFNGWKNLIIDEHHRYGYKDDYKGNIEVTLIERTGNENASALMLNAFPININAFDLSANTNDDFLRLPVSFMYDDITYNI
jgi:hypothetical protein